MNGDKAPIALIGAGGQTGQVILQRFCQEKIPVRLLRRSTGTARENVEVRQADLENLGQLTAGLAGCSQVYYIPPAFDAREETYATHLIEAMHTAGLSRVIYHSVQHAPTLGLPHHARKARVENLFRDSKMDWAILQPAMYMQSSLMFLDAEAGRLAPAFSVHSRFSAVDLTDIAEVVLKVATQPGHSFATYELAGAQLLSFEDMAEQMSQALGRPVEAQQTQRSELIKTLARVRGFSVAALAEFELMLDHYDQHGLFGSGNILSWLLGRQPGTYQEMLKHSLARAA